MRRARGLLVVLALAGAGLPPSAFGHADADALVAAAAEAVRDRPDDPARHLHQGQVHQIAGDWDAALAAFARADRLGADPDEVAAARGRLFLAAKRPALAKREFDRVLAHRPDASAILFERGRACLALGQPAKAARDFGRAIPGLASPTPEHVLARRDALLLAGRRAEAVAALDEGMAHVGPVPSLALAAIDLEEQLGRPDAAVRRLDALLAATPRHEAWLVRRGDLLVQAGHPDEARASYARALELLAARPPQRKGRPLQDLERRTREGTTPTPSHAGGRR